MCNKIELAYNYSAYALTVFDVYAKKLHLKPYIYIQ